MKLKAAKIKKPKAPKKPKVAKGIRIRKDHFEAVIGAVG
jgi:hypothetical protein